jgi:uncharacterized membrane protein
MAFCPSCGTAVQGKFCPACGKVVGDAPGPSAGAPGPAVGVPAAGMQDNVAGTLAYVLGLITGIIFLVLEPYNRNRVIRFHAFQSIFLNVALIAFHIVLSILGMVFLAIPGVGLVMAGLFGMVSMLVSLGFVVLWIVLMVKTYGGSKMVLPIIGPLAEKQA